MVGPLISYFELDLNIGRCINHHRNMSAVVVPAAMAIC
jgi:hypothetical protein